MSGSLLEIRGRIKSVKNTKKITKAMKLVAASKMKQFQKKALSSRDFAGDLLNILNTELHAQTQDNIFTKSHEKGKTMFILYTSDKGLCGGLNSKLIKALFNSKKWTELDDNKKILVTVGKKGADYANYNDIKITKSFNGINEKLDSLEALEIIDYIASYWTKHKLKNVYMIAPHFKNSLVFYPVIKQYFPFTKEMIAEHLNVEEIEEKKELKKQDLSDKTIYFEPSEEKFKETLTKYIIESLFFQSFLELKANEYSSRMIAMQNATDAAGEMIDKLTLQLNKARQAAITQQIAEIVGGSMT